jgi:hypothetical protein
MATEAGLCGLAIFDFGRQNMLTALGVRWRFQKLLYPLYYLSDWLDYGQLSGSGHPNLAVRVLSAYNQVA